MLYTLADRGSSEEIYIEDVNECTHLSQSDALPSGANSAYYAAGKSMAAMRHRLVYMLMALVDIWLGCTSFPRMQPSGLWYRPPRNSQHGVELLEVDGPNGTSNGTTRITGANGTVLVGGANDNVSAAEQRLTFQAVWDVQYITLNING